MNMETIDFAVHNLKGEQVGSVNLSPWIFVRPIRIDIIKRVIDWQLAKRRAGTHCTRTISEVSGTTKKPFKQKGTGKARQGSLRSAHMRGGGVSHGPVVRSHAIELTKKFRKLGLAIALASKYQEGRLLVLDDIKLDKRQTSEVQRAFEAFGHKSYFIVDGQSANNDFLASAKNLHHINVVPCMGANVYDIIKHECLVVTKSGLDALLVRLES